MGKDTKKADSEYQYSKEELRELMHLAANHADALMRSSIDGMTVYLAVVAVGISIIVSYTRVDVIPILFTAAMIFIFGFAIKKRDERISKRYEIYKKIYQKYFEKLYPNFERDDDLKKLRELISQNE